MLEIRTTRKGGGQEKTTSLTKKRGAHRAAVGTGPRWIHICTVEPKTGGGGRPSWAGAWLRSNATAVSTAVTGPCSRGRPCNRPEKEEGSCPYKLEKGGKGSTSSSKWGRDKKDRTRSWVCIWLQRHPHEKNETLMYGGRRTEDRINHRRGGAWRMLADRPELTRQGVYPQTRPKDERSTQLRERREGA